VELIPAKARSPLERLQTAEGVSGMKISKAEHTINVVMVTKLA
jgi:hypothetical protein